MLLLVAALAAFALPLRGERIMTLEQCVDSALVCNPSVAGAGLEIEKAVALQGTAFNPSFLDITLKQETTGGGGPENGVAFSQEFDFPSIYVARHKALTAQTGLSRNRFMLLCTEIETEVAQSYYSLLYYKELLRLNSMLDSVYGEFIRIAEIRLEAGEGGMLELMNARRVCEKNRADRAELLSQQSQAALKLQRLTGCREEIAPADTALLPIPFVPGEFDFLKTPGGIVAGSEVDVADREHSLARQELLPGLHVGATVQAFIKGFNPYHIDREPFRKGNFMAFEVGVSVPLFFGAGTSKLKAAGIERQLSRLRLETARSQAEEEVEGQRRRWALLAEKMDYYEREAVPGARKIREIAEISYRLGEIGYVEYISNVETAFSILTEFAACVNDYNQTVLTLKKLLLTP